MSKEAGILFDYNGVIVDDEHLQEQAMAHVTEKYGLSLTPELYRAYCFGRSDKAAFTSLQAEFPQLKVTNVDELVEEKVQQYQKIVEEKPILFPGIEETLQLLCKDFVLSVVTGSLRIEVEPILKEGNILQFFKTLVTADDINHSKPNPEGYLKGVHLLGLPPRKIVFVEDTPVGIQAGKAAGLKGIAVCHSLERSQLRQADVILKTVTEVTPDLVWSMVAKEL